MCIRDRPLIVEQFLAVAVGMADSMMVSVAGRLCGREVLLFLYFIQIKYGKEGESARNDLRRNKNLQESQNNSNESKILTFIFEQQFGKIGSRKNFICAF